MMTSTSKTKGFYNKSLERALRILLSFNSGQKTGTLSQLARNAMLPKSTTLRLCATMLQYGFLQYDEQTKQYSPGLALFALGGLVYSSFSLNRIARPYLSNLQETVQQTVFMDILQDDQVLHIDKRENPSSPIRFGLQVGTMRPPHYGAPAQLLMAYLSDDTVERMLAKYPLKAFTKKTITDESLFKAKLGIIRSQEYCIDEGEIIDGLTVVAAPVRDHSKEVVAALAVAYVSETAERKERKRILDEAVKTAKAISQAMGYAG
jgi:DNA-binding IclR family transcriptional regulator